MCNFRPLIYKTIDLQDETPLTPDLSLIGQIGYNFAAWAFNETKFNFRISFRRIKERRRHSRQIWITQLLQATEAATRCVLQRKVFLKSSQISQENPCVGVFFNKVARFQCLFFNKVAGLSPVQLTKFLRTHVLKNICQRLLL